MRDHCDVIGCKKPWEFEVENEARVCETHSHATHYRRWHCALCGTPVPSRAEALRQGPHHLGRCARHRP